MKKLTKPVGRSGLRPTRPAICISADLVKFGCSLLMTKTSTFGKVTPRSRIDVAIKIVISLFLKALTISNLSFVVEATEAIFL